MCKKPSSQRGLTLVEMIVAIVIIAVGLAGVLSVFNTTVRASADPMIQKQLLAIAEGMMDEVVLLPFAAPPAPDNWTGASTCANRKNFDNIDDYSGYNGQGVCDYDGNVVLPGYSVTVRLDGTLGLGSAPAVPNTDTKKITITVQRNDNDNESVTLTGWRTNWAN